MNTERMPKIVAIALALTACADDPGAGTATFSTWGEEYIEEQIPSDPTGEAGFVDGWTLHYEKFLVVFRAIRVADERGQVGAELPGSLLVDNTVPGRKELAVFPGLAAKHWTRVSYEIGPADADTELVAGDPADLTSMVDGG
jgi:hypothetical protein